MCLEDLWKGMVRTMRKNGMLWSVSCMMVLLSFICSSCTVNPDTQDATQNTETEAPETEVTKPMQNEKLLQTEMISTSPYGTTKNVMTYDEFGRLITTETYSDGALSLTCTVTYDENGYKNSDVQSGSIDYKDEWINSADGKILSGKITSKTSFGTMIFSYAYEYDDNGRILSYVRTDSNEHVIQQKKYRYTDENGSYVLTETGEGYPEAVVTCIANAQGTIVEKIVVSGGRETTRTKYDEHGNEIEIISDGGKVTYKNTYSNTLLTQIEITDSDGELVQKTVYAYDESGNLLSVVITDASGTIIDHTEIIYTLCTVKES